ncbi:benzoate/H(+) symporter BenE family transporter [Brevibacillus sp. 179-C9.3 HS]|uniref:benzoate/H(+) symporter BenE family transporter n=1 Tax=unclassified Brevibacillus TaxID=2684853 RepID=UPI0039A11C1B
MTEVKERECALVTFLVTISGISIGGIGAAFWGLIAGVITNLILNGNVKSWFVKKKNTQPLA